MALPLNEMLRFPQPVYVPGWISTVSPSLASSMAAWMLLKSAGPSSSTVIIQARQGLAATNTAKNRTAFFIIFASGFYLR